MIKIVNEDGDECECSFDQLPVMERAGWKQPVKAKAEPEPEPEPEPAKVAGNKKAGA